MPSVNMTAVLVSAIGSFVLMALIYGPLFGKLYIKVSGATREKPAGYFKVPMKVSFLVAFIGTFITADVLAHEQYAWNLVYGNTISSTSFIFQLAFWIWLGFIAVNQLSEVLWAGRNLKHFTFSAIASFVTLFVMAWILVAWK